MDKDYYLLQTKKLLAKTPQSIIDATNKNRIAEEKLWQCVENGDLEAYEKIKEKAFSYVIWKRRFYGDDCVRDLSKVSDNELYELLSIFIAVGSRRALSGGATPIEVFTLADLIRSDLNTNRNPQHMTELANIFIYSLIQLVNKNKQSDTGLVGKVKRYIKDNIYKKLSLKSISEALEINYITLSTEFSKKANMTLSKFILLEKCKEAKSLLAKTNKPISEISEELCFSSQSHFQRVFKELVGITPNEYRKTSA